MTYIYFEVNCLVILTHNPEWSVHVAEQLALPTSVHGVPGSNPAGGEILSEPKRCFIAQSLSCSPFHRLKLTEILLKGGKTLTHPSIHNPEVWCSDVHTSNSLQGLMQNHWTMKYRPQWPAIILRSNIGSDWLITPKYDVHTSTSLQDIKQNHWTVKYMLTFTSWPTSQCHKTEPCLTNYLHKLFP